MVLRNVTKNLMTDALGRRLEWQDMPAIRSIVSSAAGKDNRFSAFVAAIVSHPGFRMSEAGPLDGARATAAQPPAAQDRAPLASAAEREDAAAVRALLAEGVDVDAAQGDGMTALHRAAMHGDAGMVAAVPKAGANVSVVTRINAYRPLMNCRRE